MDLSSLVHLDQTAARKLVSLLSLAAEKSPRVVASPSEQVASMLVKFEASQSNFFHTLAEAAAVVLASRRLSPHPSPKSNKTSSSEVAEDEEEESKSTSSSSSSVDAEAHM